MSDDTFTLSFDRVNRVLMSTAGKLITVQTLAAIGEIEKRFPLVHGACSMILDTSPVEKMDVPHEVLVELGRNPVEATAVRRIIVTSTPFMHRLAQMVELYRSQTPSTLTIVRTLDEALEICNTTLSNFEPFEMP